MANRTEAELATGVMRAFGWVDATESPSAEDQSYVISRYRDLHAELADDGMAYWDVASIPVVVFEPLIQFLGLSCGNAFGKAATLRDLEEGMKIFKRRLGRHTSKKSTDLPTQFEVF